jgi:hypothetical protein
MVFADFQTSFGQSFMLFICMAAFAIHLLKKGAEKHPEVGDEFKKHATGKAIDLIRRIFKK